MNDAVPAAEADRMLAEVAELVRAGEHQRARALCERLQQQSPDDPDVLVWLGQLAMADDRWADAIATFDRLLQLRVDPWSLANLGNCYCKTGRLADAEYCLRGAIALKPDLARAHLGLAAVQHGMRRFDDCIASTAAAAQLDPVDHEIPMRRGCALVEQGRLDEALQAFAESCRLAGRFVYPRLVEFDSATFAEISSAAPAPTLPQMVDAVHDGDCARVVLVSCDPLYLRRYGLPFMRSFAQHAARGDLLHIHIYDPDAQSVDEVRATARQAALSALAVSTEDLHFPAGELQRRRAYYACGRLIHMPYFLRRYQRPVLSLDVDIIVRGSLDSLFDAVTGCDVALNRREPIDSPWLDIIANIIVVNPTAAAVRYMETVGRYAMRWIRREAQAWMVDQTALYCVLQMMQLHAPAQMPSVAWISQAAHPGLWHYGAANEHSMADPRYLQYAGRDSSR